MKATGIVRRIDDLGRVVIPKEIRRTMRIREGDPLEIFLDGDKGVVFRKYALEVSSELFGISESLRDDGKFELANALEEVAKRVEKAENEG